jgi:hypothetical protein
VLIQRQEKHGKTHQGDEDGSNYEEGEVSWVMEIKIKERVEISWVSFMEINLKEL